MHDPILVAVTEAALVAALILFLVRLARGMRRGRASDFGLGFTAFVTAWTATELIEALAPSALEVAMDALHFLVLLALAAWLIGRWRWALRSAEEEGAP